MRYCPNCDAYVDTHLSGGQVFLIILFIFLSIATSGIFIIVLILYCCLHKRKCPICGAKTYKSK